MHTQGLLSKSATIKLSELGQKPHVGSSTPFSLTTVRSLRNEYTQWATGCFVIFTNEKWLRQIEGTWRSSPSRVTASGGAPRSDNPTWSLLLWVHLVNISLLIILFIFSRIYADKHDRRRGVPDSSGWREDTIIFHVSVGNCNESVLIISLHLTTAEVFKPSWAFLKKHPHPQLKHKSQLLIWTNCFRWCHFRTILRIHSWFFSVTSVWQVSVTAWTNVSWSLDTQGCAMDALLKTKSNQVNRQSC